MSKLVDLTGQQFGGLTVLWRGPNGYKGSSRYYCACICGEVSLVCARDLRTGKSTSCGCRTREAASERMKRLYLGKTGSDTPAFGRTGPASGNWNPDRESLKSPINKTIRHSAEYLGWRLMVFGRDNFTCQDCGAHGVYLEAHHLFSFSEWEELRFDIDNGQTLCKECHDKYAKKGTHTHRR